MSDASDSHYMDWRAPEEDGRFLIWPEPARLLRDTLANQKRLSACEARIQNVPLGELRRRQRELAGHGYERRPLIVSGHQTELYHPGVWAKLVLIDAAASKLGGAAIHLAVDTDAAKHLHLRWPGGAEPISQDSSLTSAAWSGLLAAPTPAHLNNVREKFTAAAAAWPFAPLATEFLTMDWRGRTLPEAMAASLHALDSRLGLHYAPVLASPLWMGEPHLALAHHVMARMGEFAAAYNEALAAYRRENRIKSPGRPWPDLRVENGRCEAPFWLDDLSAGARSRAVLSRVADRWELRTGDQCFTFDPAADGWSAAAALATFLRDRQLRLSPRALMLTTFVRLLLADQFVHGIGGGRYDQVTDRVIAGFFGIEPPAFSVCTATLYFPLALGQRRLDLYPILQEGRRLRHGLLSEEKMRAVQEIESLPRHSPQRQELFYQMHRKLSAAMRGTAWEQWERRLAEAEELRRQQKDLFDRELFYAVQPAERLKELMGRMRGAVKDVTA